MIKKIIEEREIQFLFHFTQARNLPSILDYGLLPLSELKDQNIIIKQ